MTVELDQSLSRKLRNLAPQHESPWSAQAQESPTRSAAIVPMSPAMIHDLADSIRQLEIEVYCASRMRDDWRKLVHEWQAHIDSIACAIAFDLGRSTP